MRDGSQIVHVPGYDCDNIIRGLPKKVWMRPFYCTNQTTKTSETSLRNANRCTDLVLSTALVAELHLNYETLDNHDET